MENKVPVSTTAPNNAARQSLGCGSSTSSSSNNNNTYLPSALSASNFSDYSSSSTNNEISPGSSTPRCSTLPSPSSTPNTPPRSALGRLLSEPNPFPYQNISTLVPGLESVDSILRHKQSRRTFQLLCSLVEPKMQSPNWCEPLLKRRRSRAQAQASSQPSTVGGTDVTDGGGGSASIRASAVDPGDASFQPEGQSVHLSPRRTSRLVLASDPNLPDNISLEVKRAARKLVDFFEERYSEKVGSLLDDALQVGTAGESPSTASEEESGSLSPSSTPHSPEMMLSVARLHYRTVLHELFAQQINWGRIIAMFSFLRALCQMLESLPSEPSSSQWLPTEPIGEVNEAPQSPLAEVLHPVDQTDACYASPPTTGAIPRPQAKLSPLRGDSAAGDRAIVGRLDRRAVHYIIWTTEYIHDDRNLWNWIVNHNNWEGLVAFEAGADDTLQSQFVRALVSIGGVILGTLGIAAALRFVTRRL